MFSGIDNTRHGHVIGVAQVHVPAPERKMTAASTSVVRLLLHMSMFLGAAESPQVVISFSSIILEIVCVCACMHVCVNVNIGKFLTYSGSNDVQWGWQLRLMEAFCLLFTAVELQLAELQTCAQTLNKGL